MTTRVEKRAISLYPEQWAVVEQIAQTDAAATGDRPNISLALRRIITQHARRQQSNILTDEGVGYSVGEPLDPRPEYTFDEYVAYRSSTQIPIIAELDAFRAFTQGQGALPLSEWIGMWNAFCDMQDATYDAANQSERSDGLEDTADAALGGHYEPVPA